MTQQHPDTIRAMTEAAPRPTYYPTPAQPSPTAVVIHQPDPLVVTHWPSTVTHVLRVLAVLLGCLHALTCIVFLWVVYSVNQGLNELQENLSQLGSLFGAGG